MSDTPDVDRRQERRVNDTARTECYQRIRECIKTGIEDYYREHPKLFLDDRSRDALARSYRGLGAILKVLDDFKIEWLDKDGNGS